MSMRLSMKRKNRVVFRCGRKFGASRSKLTGRNEGGNNNKSQKFTINLIITKNNRGDHIYTQIQNSKIKLQE